MKQIFSFVFVWLLSLFYFNDRSEQFAKLLTQCHPLTETRSGQLGRNKQRRKFLRTGKRALGMLLLTNQFYDSCLSSIYGKNPAKTAYKNLVFQEPTSWIWHLNAQKYTNLFSLAKKNRSLYKTITPVLLVKILDFNCVRNFWQNIIVYMFSLIYICLEFH